MLYFPQLASGAVAQFPCMRAERKRTVINSVLDGSEVKLADPSWSRVEWQLDLTGLTDDEWQAIESLFRAAEGRLGSFTFLDPSDNLLSFSENFGAGAWLRDPALQITDGIADPLGSLRASRINNPLSGSGSIEQALNIPGWFQYCFSVYVRAGLSGQISLFRRTASNRRAQSFSTGPEWRRIEYGARVDEPGESVAFGLEVPGSASLDVFGFQLEAQAGASAYKKAFGRGGIYPESRFVDDTLPLTTEALGLHSCSVRITARFQS